MNHNDKTDIIVIKDDDNTNDGWGVSDDYYQSMPSIESFNRPEEDIIDYNGNEEIIDNDIDYLIETEELSPNDKLNSDGDFIDFNNRKDINNEFDYDKTITNQKKEEEN